MVYGTALTDKIHPHPISFAHSMALSTSPHGILSRKSPLSLLPSSFLTFWAVAMIGRWNEEVSGNTENEAITLLSTPCGP